MIFYLARIIYKSSFSFEYLKCVDYKESAQFVQEANDEIYNRHVDTRPFQNKFLRLNTFGQLSRKTTISMSKSV